jgi:uncharacterized repeat protein (TIGR01451 family)
MSNISRLLGTMRRRVATAAILMLAVAFPIAATAASTVKITANTTVANASKHQGWKSSTTAGYNDVVDVQVVYNNKEKAGSGKVAKNLTVKINIPTKAGTNQTITTKTSADNSNTVNGSAKVTLSRADAYLQYIPGTATWKHSVSANSTKTTTQKVSDNVVLGANGLRLENENPCQAGSIQVQARVMVPGLTVDKFVRIKGSTDWNRSISAKAGDTLQYEIAYQNTGNTAQKSVMFRDQLPKGVTYVPGSTMLNNTSNPNGYNVPNDSLVASNGITVGDYLPGAAAYVMFEVKINSADKLSCGDNLIRNMAYVMPKGMNYYWNTADVHVNVKCESQPQYSCDAFHVTLGDKRSVTVDKFNYTAKNGAEFKSVVIDFGDGSDSLTTDKAVGQTHTYAKDGKYTLTATAHFTANGKDVTDIGSCTQTVSFNTPTVPPTTPPKQLVNTGAGDVIGLFGLVAVAGAVMHRAFSRRLSRQ